MARNIETSASYDKFRFNKIKAKILKFDIGDLVLIQNEEVNQTKLERTYKFTHDRLGKIPVGHVPGEIDVI